MIYLYSGTPGSGKSLHSSKDIIFKLRRKQAVISNFDINLEVVKENRKSRNIKLQIQKQKVKIEALLDKYDSYLSEKSITEKQLNKLERKLQRLDRKIEKLYAKKLKVERKIGNFIYNDNSELTVDFLVEYAKKNHVKGREGQTLVVIDECAVLFNSRSWSDKGRDKWIKFFQMHRHYGYNIILVSQNDRLIDRQIRAFIEYDVKHRKANNLGTIGLLISLLRVQLFAAISYWYGVREKCGSEFFVYRKIYSQLYDSYSQFESC